jgi:periplasmic copper chaperone A
MTIRRRLALPAALLAALLALALAWPGGGALGHSYRHGDVQIGHIWAKPAAAGDGLAVFGPLLAGGKGDRLVGASSPDAERVGFRRMENGRETVLPALDLAPGQVLALAEWREHIRLEGLKRTLREGDRVPLTLRFAGAGPIEVEIHIETTPGH